MQKEKYRNIVEKTLFFLLMLVCFFVVSKCAVWLLGLLFPFIVSWVIAVIIRPITVFLHKYTKISKKVWSAIFVSAIVLFLGSLLFFLLTKLVNELQEMSGYIFMNYERIISVLMDGINGLSEKIPFFRPFGSQEELLAVIYSGVARIISGISSNIPYLIKNVATLFPNVLFLSVILITSSYYFCADYDIVKKMLRRSIPESSSAKLEKIKETVQTIGKKVIRGYLIIMSMTFLLVYIGLLVLGVKYAFATAVIMSVIDMLPIIGVGIVLVPWALFNIIMGEYFVGFGLLIIFGIVCIVREVLEPKIIGESIGLHPLLTLFFMYIGLKLFGFLGMFLLPFGVTVIKNTYK